MPKTMTKSEVKNYLEGYMDACNDLAFRLELLFDDDSDLDPETIPEAKAIPVKWLLSLSDNPMFTDNFRNDVVIIAKLWREAQEANDAQE